MTSTSGSLVSLLLFTLLSASLASGSGLLPYHLECEARSNPLGIDAAYPRVSWKLKSDRQADRQVAYQIVVASTKLKLDSAAGDL